MAKKEKVSKISVFYIPLSPDAIIDKIGIDTPEVPKMCKTCTQSKIFKDSQTCASVEGDISPDGYCTLYKARYRRVKRTQKQKEDVYRPEAHEPESAPPPPPPPLFI